jgi:aspartate aminotransferase
MTHPVDLISFGAIVAVRDRLLEQQAHGRTIYRLESGDPSFDVPSHVEEAIHKALRDKHTHYTASTGIQPLREAIVAKLARENKLPIEHPDQVVVTSGGMHALYLTFRALLDPGDEVVLPDPMWTEIAENIRLAGGVPVRCKLDPSRGMAYEAADIEKHVGPKTKAIFLNTPHNPTGAVLSRAALQEIADLAARKNVRLLSDEAYEHVIFDGQEHVSIGSLPGAEERTISIYSTSKSYAMSGLRIGYIGARDKLFLERVKKLLRCTTNGVNSIAQHGATAALRGPLEPTLEMAREYQARRDLLLEGLRGVRALEPFRPRGSFFLWLRIHPSWPGYQGKRDDWGMTNFLIDQGGVGSSPGTAFGPAGEGCIRFAFSCDRKQIEAALVEIRRLLA